MPCLFCRSDGPFSTTEHIVPESLGNDTDVLNGVVCDNCQSYLGRSVEKPALEGTLFGFWRTILSVPTKSGGLPKFSSIPPRAGAFASHHPWSDRFEVVAMPSGGTSLRIEGATPSVIPEVGTRGNLSIVLTPWQIFTMGRLLGKIGLEYLAKHQPDAAMSSHLDPIRSYVRRGSVGWLWPISLGTSGTADSLRMRKLTDPSTGELKIECYKFALGEDKAGRYIFAFEIGMQMLAINLSSSEPFTISENAVHNTVLQCIHYPKNTLAKFRTRKANSPPSSGTSQI